MPDIMYDRSTRIIISFLFVLMVVFLLLVSRCFYLQYFKSDHYTDICTKQQQGWITNKPCRGVIVDCQGRVLAASNKIQIIFAEPRIIKDPKSVSSKLAPIIDMPAHKICKLITTSKNPGFAKIKVAAQPNQYKQVRKIYGIGVQSDWQRYYPMGPLASHVVGFTSMDNRGLAGIELQYDKELRGSVGQSIFFADVLRRPIRQGKVSGQRTAEGVQRSTFKDGCGIILTLDATIQQFARVELIKQYESYQAQSAIAIVAEPKTGSILAMVSLPDFDPTNAHNQDPNNLRNRAITDQFEPGSLLKPIVAAIAIDSGVVTTTEKIFCEYGDYKGPGFGRIGEYGNHKFGHLTVREILVHSSNIGMAKIGQKLGKNKLYNGLKLFGLGKKTGIDLPGEARGLLHPVHKWTGYSTTRIPFGQEISVTAIQMIQAFCILANGGRLVRPKIVKAIVDDNGELCYCPFAIRNSQVAFVVKPQVANWIVKDAMVSVVNEGTGKKAKLEKWQVFGKTGTASIAQSGGTGYSDRDYVASFIAGAPAEDPAVVVLVVIYKPNIELGKGYTGGTVAAPVAAKILEKTLNYIERQGFL